MKYPPGVTLAALRQYLHDVTPRVCPECHADTPDEKHLPECPWRWVEEAR